MATEQLIEEETGIYVRSLQSHPHNGYYSGDFTSTPVIDPYCPRFDIPWKAR